MVPFFRPEATQKNLDLTKIVFLAIHAFTQRKITKNNTYRLNQVKGRRTKMMTTTTTKNFQSLSPTISLHESKML